MDGYRPAGNEVIQIGTDWTEFRDIGNEGGYGWKDGPQVSDAGQTSQLIGKAPYMENPQESI